MAYTISDMVPVYISKVICSLPTQGYRLSETSAGHKLTVSTQYHAGSENYINSQGFCPGRSHTTCASITLVKISYITCLIVECEWELHTLRVAAIKMIPVNMKSGPLCSVDIGNSITGKAHSVVVLQKTENRVATRSDLILWTCVLIR